MSAEPSAEQQQPTPRLPLWRILVCLGCLAVCLAIVLTSPKPATHQNTLLQTLETIGNAGLLRQILLGLFFCLAVAVTIPSNRTKAS